MVSENAKEGPVDKIQNILVSFLTQTCANKPIFSYYFSNDKKKRATQPRTCYGDRRVRFEDKSDAKQR